jgi:hypothetical protein
VLKVLGLAALVNIPMLQVIAELVRPKLPITMKKRIPTQRHPTTVAVDSLRSRLMIPRRLMMVRSFMQVSCISFRKALDLSFP